MESCAAGLTIFYLFFSFVEKLDPLVHSTMHASFKAQGRRPRDSNKGDFTNMSIYADYQPIPSFSINRIIFQL